MNNKPRKPWLAGLLTLLQIGLGHIYAGKPKQGLRLFGIGLLLGILFCLLIIIIPNIFFMIIPGAGYFAFFVFCIVNAVSAAREGKEHYEPAGFNKWYVYVGAFLLLVFISAIVSAGTKLFLLRAYRIPAPSMSPTLLVGDHVLVNKSIYGIKIPISRDTIIPVAKPKRDDVVVFIYPNDRSKDFIKRVIGVGGDKIEIINKKVFINDVEYKDTHGFFKDSYILERRAGTRDNFGPVTVPDNAVFVLGDNRDESLDGRFWGFVDLKDIKGKVFMIYWSWDRNKHEVRWGRVGKPVE